MARVAALVIVVIGILPIGGTMLVERLAFHRRDDPSHEYRELLLYEERGQFNIWEVIGFLDGTDADWNPTGGRKRTQLALGREWHMRKRLAEETNRLREEGFTACEPTAGERQ